MTIAGSTRSSDPVSFRPDRVIPQTSVASDPAKVVGTAMTGRLVESATAFPSPVADPPPMVTITSTSPSAANARAFSTSLIGTCWTTRKIRRVGVINSATRSATAADDSPAINSTRCLPSASSARRTLASAAPEPKYTRCPRVTCSNESTTRYASPNTWSSPARSA
jgi:hypothetical protein